MNLDINSEFSPSKHIPRTVSVTVCPSAAQTDLHPLVYLYHPDFCAPPILCLPPSPSPLFSPQHLFTEIGNLGLMFKASVQLLGRLLDVISVSLLGPPLHIPVTLAEYILFSPRQLPPLFEFR